MDYAEAPSIVKVVPALGYLSQRVDTTEANSIVNTISGINPLILGLRVHDMDYHQKVTDY